MKGEDKLFQLIKSLSKSEKRYFKLFASIYGGRKNYLLLFEAIDAQGRYDEEALRVRFKDERFIRQLNAAKHYLYEQILRSLRVHHAGTSVRARIRDLIQNIEILYEKGLRDQALKIYETALELATEHEELVSTMQILSWGTKLMPVEAISEEHIDERYRPLHETIDKYRNYLQYLAAMVKMKIPTTADRPRTTGELDALERMMEAFPGMEEPLSVKARILYCWSQSSYHHLRGNDSEALRYTEMQVALHEEHPAMIQVNPTAYLLTMTNYLHLLKRSGELDAFWSAMDATRRRVEELLASSTLWGPRVGAGLFATLYQNQLSHALELKERSRYRELAEAVERGLVEHAGHIHGTAPMRLDHMLTRIYRELGDLRAALDCNNRIVQRDRPEVNHALYHHARLMKLVLHYELGHTELLDYLVLSTYRYFRSRRVIFAFEDAVLDFFRRLLRLKGGKRELLGLFRDLRERLLTLRQDPLEREPFSYFDYIAWLDEKIAAIDPRADDARIAA